MSCTSVFEAFFWKSYLKNIILSKSNLDKGLWVIDNWSKNYFHWITDVLPRLITCEQAGVSYPVLLPVNFLNIGYIKESLDIFHFEYLPYTLDKCYFIKELYAPSHLCPCGGDPEQLQSVRLKFRISDKFDYSASRRIYISRSKASRRIIQNELDLIILLNKYYIDCVYMEDLNFYEQRKLMSESNFIISNHGAGLTNMIFMPDNSKVIELVSDSSIINACFFNLARALGHQYYYTINHGDSNNVQRSNITVDLKKLDNLLKQLF
ncbi:MAG: DUF563 domain-containing protein [Bacteroidetes bacterium]|nr:DUF563 domain-containing protein [Bacteroidota bacterium]